MDLEDIVLLRNQVWDAHPIIIECAILPTPGVQHIVSLVSKAGRKSRASLAVIANPMTGKSFCAKAVAIEMKRSKPGCGVLIFEVVEDEAQAEGRILSEFLNQIDFAPTIVRDLSGKRKQVHRALLALAGDAKHLFLIFDEAQELSPKEYAWIKAVINRLVNDHVKVTVVLFGQTELREKISRLEDARSDLVKRFGSKLYNLVGLRNVDDLSVVLEAMDSKSEFPAGSGLTYTQLLLPRFYAAGGRLAAHAEGIWAKLSKYRSSRTANSVSMSICAGFLANLMMALRGHDSEDMKITSEFINKIPVD
ncbi:ATP-binding protein [Pseudoxanthomonas sp. SL93]|uniref:ATP-binding protein n=1 Tax=Pseudoxanthomonas sp. SL93 TaxID=2995142 RepID=UPI00226E93A7|nr:ATP-binding protein [Pseudoxanthomonas sp. SL93]WAC64020.1 ATP-binding protein [Pseudoxanthomonas sp. SL93]